ncbi:MAG: SDR family oxidoreductase [Hyphomonadaceae bacterium]|nr:SDR family oxidoreductase [Hyphomonadaceae bacterium]
MAARLEGKVALISGATGGIGEATARAFLREGAKVLLFGRSAEKLRDTAARLGAGKDALATFQGDAGEESAAQGAVAATAAAFGGVDILFANAGVEGAPKRIDQLEEAEFEVVLRTNLIGVWAAIKHCAAPMKARGGGSMIATSSVLGTVGFAGSAPYVASKHAVIGLVRTAALELGRIGIRVNAIAPGFIDNPMMRRVGAEVDPAHPDAVEKKLTSQTALRRYGTNEEVAQLAVYLASDEASYTTGGVHILDGGFTAA